MSISTTTRHALATGNGVTVAFSFPIKFLDDSHLEVYVADVLQTIVTDYTVAGAGVEAGGTVTFEAGSTPGAVEVLILRVTPRTQPSDYVANAKFSAQDVEDDFDRRFMVDVDNNGTSYRGSGTPESSQAGYADTLDRYYDTTNFVTYQKVAGLGTTTGWDTV